ncbi:MAG TPA: carboxypeptidase-like regulatory domain-containing protein, partial [Candidatus Cloacimonas sp.]|nr:carboxypeptidase-like regulatory domain-containing protein [Candidatus Cloacimonas sp.]
MRKTGAVSEARIVRYNPGGGTTQGYTDADGRICWNNIPTGSYSIEAHKTGTFWGEEYWGDVSGTVNSGQTTNLTLNRINPYIESITIRNHSSGAIINPTQQITPGTTIRAEIVVRNKVSSALGVKVHLLFDRSQSSPYESSQISSDFFSISGNSTRTFTFVYAPTETGVWYRAAEVTTRLLNGNIRRTDSWPWAQVLSIVDVDLIQSVFSKVKYQKGETVTASFVLRNNSSALVENVRLKVDFISPSGVSVEGVTGLPFNINPNSTVTYNNFAIWTIPSSATSGAYLPVVSLLNSNNEVIKTYNTSASSSVLPIIPIGSFPQLNALIVKSQYQFSPSNQSDIASVMQQFKNSGISHLSLSVKLDDGSGKWPSQSTYSGRVLFNSSHITPSGINPLPFDFYHIAQEAAQINGILLDPWVPTLSDQAAWTDHSDWRLNGASDEYFLDPSLSAVRNYETSLIKDLVETPYNKPNCVTIDHFRYTNSQNHSSYITSFVSEVKSILPIGTKLTGYMFRPGDTYWSGQDYSTLQNYLDFMAPMLYWQDWADFSLGDNVSAVAREWVSKEVESIIKVLGPATTKQKVRGTLSITSRVSFNDGNSYVLDDYEWKRTQINVLGALGDAEIQTYDMFLYGDWLQYVDLNNLELGKWVDRAVYLSSLNPSPPVALIHLNSPNGGENWPVASTQNITWTSSGTSGNVR